MKTVLDFLLKKKVVVFLAVIFTLCLGFITVINLNKEAFPNVSLDMVTIVTVYPGAAPDEVEKLITIPIEKQLRGIVGVSTVESFNLENFSFIVAYIEDSLTPKKKNETIDKVKNSIENFTGLPEDSQRPEITEITTEIMPVLDLALIIKDESPDGYRTIREIAKQLEEELLFVDGVAEIQKYGYKKREYLVEVSPESMKDYNIGLNLILHRLQSKNLNLPGGALRIGEKEFILRTIGQFEDAEDIANTVIFSNDAGFITRLSDLAEVTDTFEEDSVIERVNGNKAIILKVNKKQSKDIMKLNESLYAFVNEANKNLPDNVELFYFNDISLVTRDSLSSLLSNATMGFFLLILILYFMLGLRMASIVSISIPVSFMIAFIVMKQQGITLNMISMFALLMVLGMIVDYSIVVAENIFRYMENGMDKKKAVEKGLKEVAVPVTVTFLCTVVAFVPLLFLTGIMGKFVYALPMVIIICLFSSWICAIFILPVIMDSFAKVKKGAKKENLPQNNKSSFYRSFLRTVIKFRYPVVIFSFVFLIAVGYLGIKKLDFIFLPSTVAGVNVTVTMPQGFNLQSTGEHVLGIEQLLMSLPKDEVESIQTKIGEEQKSGIDMSPTKGTHRSSIVVHLVPEGQRKRTGVEIADNVRNIIAEATKKGIIDSRANIKIELIMLGPPQGKSINVEIRGNDIEEALEIAEEYKQFLLKMEGVQDIGFNIEDGKTEYRYKINDAIAIQTGISVVDSARALLTSYQGTVPTIVKKGDEEIDVRVRFPDWARRTEKSLGDVMVANNQGGLIPLSKITEHEKREGYSMISRKNFMRVIKVQANIDLTKTTSLKVNTILKHNFHDVESNHPGVDINYGGENEEISKSMSQLGWLFVGAIIVIYLILVAFFNSLLLPIIVILTIPFSIIGVFFALFTHSEPIYFMTILGIFSLAGVIVSNTLVLVHFINTLRTEEKLSLKDSLVEAGAIRFRPILLTSGTTVLGLLPTIYGIGGKDLFVAPLGLSFGYGLVFATVITLILVPCFYHIVEDIKAIRFIKKKK